MHLELLQAKGEGLRHGSEHGLRMEQSKLKWFALQFVINETHNPKHTDSQSLYGVGIPAPRNGFISLSEASIRFCIVLCLFLSSMILVSLTNTAFREDANCS